MKNILIYMTNVSSIDIFVQRPIKQFSNIKKSTLDCPTLSGHTSGMRCLILS